jgi:hypothetical protein
VGRLVSPRLATSRVTPMGYETCLHLEADGAAWGCELDGEGRIRALDLVPVGEWE